MKLDSAWLTKAVRDAAEAEELLPATTLVEEVAVSEKNDDDIHDSDKTPAHTPDARRASQRGQRAMEPCPGCKGKDLKSADGDSTTCPVCGGVKYSNSPLTLETWKLRAVLQNSKPPKPPDV